MWLALQRRPLAELRIDSPSAIVKVHEHGRERRASEAAGVRVMGTVQGRANSFLWGPDVASLEFPQRLVVVSPHALAHEEAGQEASRAGKGTGEIHTEDQAVLALHFQLDEDGWAFRRAEALGQSRMANNDDAVAPRSVDIRFVHNPNLIRERVAAARVTFVLQQV
jgi:hypothetical protein